MLKSREEDCGAGEKLVAGNDLVVGLWISEIEIVTE